MLISSDPESIDPKAVVPKAVAPWSHTAVLVGVFLVLALAGIIFQHRAGVTEAIVPQHRNQSGLYLSLILGQWGLVYSLAVV